MRDGVSRLCWLLVLPWLHGPAWPRDGLVLAPSAGGGALRLESLAGCGTGLVLAGAAPRGSTRVDGELARLIHEVAADHGLEASLVTAIVRVESAFDPRAVSHKGALGLMQIMPATALGLGVADPARDLLDPHTNLRAGARHLRALRNRYPDRLDLAIAAYNAGEGAVSRWAGIPPYAETRQYVASVLSWYDTYRDGVPVVLPVVRGCS
ncbi:lytic transglycosylase domain-containing protein [Piscinibacter gummiphilus]|uniref:Uncharacterized protein n=1 Tax=Piscinibacter gummiphilus TaxID=946333 RepID=A0A1W6L9A1_9BURK|nr:lytic transglycosylase domain-containing protein [Piscinibacter gummiphilus]ARN20784.1 hypothetical protein A4W93_13245 [Piscinibacter gummiphilus]ATU65459.1 lytic transglycosylase domain-containing protein [Piscinibacter gummiphilus]GLS94615.1 hypothetical protein GCM10007918_19070 [Piscinibacter gummiphilus]